MLSLRALEIVEVDTLRFPARSFSVIFLRIGLRDDFTGCLSLGFARATQLQGFRKPFRPLLGQVASFLLQTESRSIYKRKLETQIYGYQRTLGAIKGRATEKLFANVFGEPGEMLVQRIQKVKRNLSFSNPAKEPCSLR